MRNIFKLSFLVTVALLVSACVGTPKLAPLHNPPNAQPFYPYEARPYEIKELEPSPSTKPRYKVSIQTGNLNIAGNNFKTNSWAYTNDDTIGLDIFKDKTTNYYLTVVSYTVEGESDKGYIITKVESVNEQNAKIRLAIEESKREEEASRKKEAEAKTVRRSAFKASSCGEVANGSYFCFDDNNKLNNHDIVTISKLLTTVTEELPIRFIPHTEETEIGQWYIESVADSTINITVTMPIQNEKKILKEVVIDLKKRAGSYYYFVRK